VLAGVRDTVIGPTRPCVSVQLASDAERVTEQSWPRTDRDAGVERDATSRDVKRGKLEGAARRPVTRTGRSCTGGPRLWGAAATPLRALYPDQGLYSPRSE